jgi:hypothetical protein
MDSHTEFDLQARSTQLEFLAEKVLTLAKTSEGNTLEIFGGAENFRTITPRHPRKFISAIFT